MFAKLKPEFVMPLVLFLVSEDNQDTSMIFNCGGGWYSRSAIVCAPGTIIGDGKRAITPEEIKDNWSKITSLEGAKYLSTLMESFGFMQPVLK
jgi:hypothetical protein